jgi:predicted nucleotidyltransferase
MPLDRNQVITALTQRKPWLSACYAVRELTLFGSFARDDAEADSDVDILVEFDGPATSRRFFGVLFDLEDLLGRSVDLVTDKALRPEFRPFIEPDAIRV